ncbi:MAG: cytidylate kinase-like family protein [Clostridiales bacterium]|nr:cytidylate kinase-like family protein [Clostridiales bacterium]
MEKKFVITVARGFGSGGKEWTDPLNYDICLNTGDISREICVDIIKDLLYKKLNIQLKENTGNLNMGGA